MIGWMMGSARLRNEIFAGNRAVGRVAFTVAAGPGGNRRTRVHETGSLRVRFPNAISQNKLDADLERKVLEAMDELERTVRIGAKG